MLLFVFKLLLTPLLIGLVSLAGRRWGPAISGWLIGLPLTSGPVALYLALEQGKAFAGVAAQGIMLGQGSVALFCLAYSWLAFRLNWPLCLLASWCLFFAGTFLLGQFTFPLLLAFLGAIACLAIVQQLFPRTGVKAPIVNPPWWETLLRMLVATAFVLLLTGVAGLLGPHLSGLLTPFPLYGSTLAAFTHHFQGKAAASRLLHGMVSGSFAFVVFFLVVAALLERLGIAATFALALLATLLVHGISLYILRRYIDRA